MYEGQFQYNDKANGVKFHGDINSPLQESCEETVVNNSGYLTHAIFAGECLLRTGNVPGHFNVTVKDNETLGSLGAGDFISVSASCTDVTEYFNFGILGGGNIMSVGHSD